MKINKKKNAIFIMLWVIGSALWVLLYKESDNIEAVGTSLFAVGGALWAFIQISRTINNSSGHRRVFWKWINRGIAANGAANGIWLAAALIGISAFPPSLADVLWLASYILFLCALLYQLFIVSREPVISIHMFNVSVFMIVSTAIIGHFFTALALELFDYSIINSVINLSFLLINSTLLFAAGYLVYLLKAKRDIAVVCILIAAFSFQSVGDFHAAYLEIVGVAVSPGNFNDVFWLAAIILLGVAATYEKIGLWEHNWMIRTDIKQPFILFPAAGITLLILFTFNSYEWRINILSVSIGIILLLFVGRNYIMNKKNSNLIQEYRHLAYYDSLTGIYNRTSFKINVDKAVAVARKEKTELSLLLFDIDRFKVINDSLGHHVGDEVLMETAYRLKNGLPYDIYRLGGDEFVIIVDDVRGNKALEAAAQVKKAFSKPYLIAGQRISITPSIGISCYPSTSRDSDSLLKSADAAMYAAKENGRNAFVFYDEKLHKKLSRKMIIESELRQGLIRHEFTLHYQPKINVQTLEVCGMEALLRWNNRKLGSVSPYEFIPIAEESGFIKLLGSWVMNEACRQAQTWKRNGIFQGTMAVNVSVHQIKYGDVLTMIREALEKSKLAPEQLEIEITESIMQDVDATSVIFDALRAHGVRVALDDFGTGYSSFHVLKTLPIDTIKIDKSFIDDLSGVKEQSLVKAIIDIGRHLQLEVVAEGVEEEVQLDALAAYECDTAQGYLFSKPLTVLEIEHFLSQHGSKAL
ncbi:diguanylate cyclase (GGDEF)-like protein [Sinobaca qinghaiensis]|uniref:Diguanylate cyclase (GGDEF)-like protein n=1 Tax=Sinobaca qinghaiensis TaxID=342944 RepID=A0A419UX69_9BACL|nr:EAL domain-containing protein [Sinobaca qinghaiensis]RKD69726.1 diguanylate cyclase (GGDEF)-like protein [Sinobaca qinghaiensis]